MGTLNSSHFLHNYKNKTMKKKNGNAPGRLGFCWLLDPRTLSTMAPPNRVGEKQSFRRRNINMKTALPAQDGGKRQFPRTPSCDKNKTLITTKKPYRFQQAQSLLALLKDVCRQTVLATGNHVTSQQNLNSISTKKMF